MRAYETRSYCRRIIILLRSIGFNTPIKAASFASHYGGAVHFMINLAHITINDHTTTTI
jgi:hypothetical protein